MNNDFKAFFNEYFDYDFSKLKFIEGPNVEQCFIKEFSVSENEIEYCYIKSEIVSAETLQYYGFYRLNNTAFFTPFTVYDDKKLINSTVEIKFRTDVRNSVFHFKFMPIKKEKTIFFIKEILTTLPSKFKSLIEDINHDFIFMLNDIKSFQLFFDIDNDLIEIINKDKKFTSTLVIKNITTFEKNRFAYIDYSCFVHTLRKYMSIRVDELSKFNKNDFFIKNFTLPDIPSSVVFSDFDTFFTLVEEYEHISKIYSY